MLFICLCIGLTMLCSVGLRGFYEESDMTALWVPEGSELRKNVDWVEDYFPQQLRYNQVIFKADNVLSPEVVQEMFNLTKRMREVNQSNQTWEDICFRIPVVTKPKCFDSSKIDLHKLLELRKKRNAKKSDECDNFKLPRLNIFQKAAFLPIIQKISTAGFSPEIGEVYFIQLLTTVLL